MKRDRILQELDKDNPKLVQKKLQIMLQNVQKTIAELQGAVVIKPTAKQVMLMYACPH